MQQDSEFQGHGTGMAGLAEVCDCRRNNHGGLSQASDQEV
jgi:hypothetical protein